MKPPKELILDVTKDLVANFLYYDRKQDEDLPHGAIEEALDRGVVSVAEIVEAFRHELVTKLIEDDDKNSTN